MHLMRFITVKIKYHNYSATFRKQNIKPSFIRKEIVSLKIKYYLSYMNTVDFLKENYWRKNTWHNHIEIIFYVI